MARRHRGSLAHLLIAAALAITSCGSADDAPAEPRPSTTATEVTTTTSTSTTLPPTTTTTTTPPTTTTTAPLPPDIGVEVLIPEGEGPFPAVVTVHGGVWVIGSPKLMSPLARYLTDAGFLTINTGYQLTTAEVPGFPGAVDDVACAVRYAAAHPSSDGSVVIIGHSAGAHLSAIVGLTGDAYASDCPVPGDGVPDRLVGLGGPYDISLLGFAIYPFFGAGPADDPDAWLAGNPQRLTESNPDLIALIVHGSEDTVVDLAFAESFHSALADSGAVSILEIVVGANHSQLTNPSFVGELIVSWLSE